MKTNFYLFLLVAISCTCTQRSKLEIHTENSPGNFPFKLDSPDKRYELPEQLREISGISAINDTVVACIGDEKGIIYFYNLHTATIQEKLHFAARGDFEDLTVINNSIFVLDSKGVLWEVNNFASNAQIKSFIPSIEPPFELEGLCHRGDTLFIAAKYYHNKKRNTPGLLPVWRLPLPVSREPAVLFLLPDMSQPASGRVNPFHTSALLFNENTNEWYCLSTHTKLILRCDYNGSIISVKVLPAGVFIQPEGICFTPSGDLLISNEGRSGNGTILLFHPK